MYEMRKPWIKRNKFNENTQEMIVYQWSVTDVNMLVVDSAGSAYSMSMNGRYVRHEIKSLDRGGI